MGELCRYFCLNLALWVFVSGLYAAAPSRRSPSLTASPSVIILGVTPSLTVNCSYSSTRSHDLATLTALTIYSRTNSSAHLHKRGVVKVLEDNGMTQTFVSKNAEGEGVIDDKGESFLFLRWSLPSRDQAVEYFCVLTAKDVEGVEVQSNAGTRVTSRTPWHIREIQQLADGYKVKAGTQLSNTGRIQSGIFVLRQKGLVKRPSTESIQARGDHWP
ncbi:unnamed protein product [Lymnaea stagnalis]|uniref:Uncharacterized protein n=1 Tax=Lymnaea stagnalis TaxID=6523 RepID=A0AAV2H2H4_LYMST